VRHAGGKGEWHRLPHFNWITDPDGGAEPDDRVDKPIPPSERRKSSLVESQGGKPIPLSERRKFSLESQDNRNRSLSSPRSSAAAVGQAKAMPTPETSAIPTAVAPVVPPIKGMDRLKGISNGMDLVHAARDAGIFTEKTTDTQSSVASNAHIGPSKAGMRDNAWEAVSPSSPQGHQDYTNQDDPSTFAPGRRKERDFCDLSDRFQELRIGSSRWRDGAGTPPPPDPYLLGVEDTDALAIPTKAKHRERWCQMKIRSCS